MFSRIKRLSTAIVIAGGIAMASGPLHGLDAPEARFQERMTQVRLTGQWAIDTYQWIEWSNDLENWQPVRRDYGCSWDSMLPETVSVLSDNDFRYPVLATNGPLGVECGRILPTTYIDAYGAELASWFGVPSAEMSTVFPNADDFFDPMATPFPLGMLSNT